MIKPLYQIAMKKLLEAGGNTRITHRKHSIPSTNRNRKQNRRKNQITTKV